MNINAVDLFCGVGGLTHGLEQAGINVIAGIDNEKSCEIPYTLNNKAEFIHADIKEVSSEQINELYPKNTDYKVLVGCAPCQPFSTYNKKQNGHLNEKMDLLDYFGKIVDEIVPDIVSMENVPGMVKTVYFDNFIKTLDKNNYSIDWKIIYGPDYDVPQTRKRLILVASRIGKIEIPERLRDEENYLTVGDVIGDLPEIKAGESDPNDPLHTSRNLKEINLKRIEQSVPGGTWQDWDEDLLPACYRKESGRSFRSVYGRMEWDKPSPTITTQFIGYGNGRFGHPSQNRALSLREGALLQTFPKSYKFFEDEKTISQSEIAKQIGNAVPVKLGNVIGESILKSIHI